MVMVLAENVPVTPVGNPVNVAPVAPVLLYVILVMAVPMQGVCAVVLTGELNVSVLFFVIESNVGDGMPMVDGLEPTTRIWYNALDWVTTGIVATI